MIYSVLYDRALKSLAFQVSYMRYNFLHVHEYHFHQPDKIPSYAYGRGTNYEKACTVSSFCWPVFILAIIEMIKEASGNVCQKIYCYLGKELLANVHPMFIKKGILRVKHLLICFMQAMICSNTPL